MRALTQFLRRVAVRPWLLYPLLFALGALGGLMMPALLLGHAATFSNEADVAQFTATTGLLFVACLAGELVERYLFFTACAAPRMPGGIR